MKLELDLFPSDDLGLQSAVRSGLCLAVMKTCSHTEDCTDTPDMKHLVLLNVLWQYPDHSFTPLFWDTLWVLDFFLHSISCNTLCFGLPSQSISHQASEGAQTEFKQHMGISRHNTADIKAIHSFSDYLPICVLHSEQ